METPYIAIFNKQSCHFFFLLQIGEQEFRTGPVWGLVTLGVGRRWGKGAGG
jgi:hypothetical protein